MTMALSWSKLRQKQKPRCLNINIHTGSKIYTHLISERPEWNFTETGPKPKYGFFTETEPKPKFNTEKIAYFF